MFQIDAAGVLIALFLMMPQARMVIVTMERLEVNHFGWALVFLAVVLGTDALFGLIIFGLGSAWVVPGFGDMRLVFLLAVVLLPVWVYYRLVKFLIEQRRTSSSA